MSHIVIERGAHRPEDVQRLMYEGFEMTQWWPVTIVECVMEHGDLCKAIPFARAQFERGGLVTREIHGPAIHCESCRG